MGLWQRIKGSWKAGKLRDEEAEKQAALDRLMKDRDRYAREQTRSPRLPPRGDRG
jgi:hypothetical protein